MRRHGDDCSCAACAADDAEKDAAKKERARIRRLIGPALRVLDMISVRVDIHNAARDAIDAATRPTRRTKKEKR